MKSVIPPSPFKLFPVEAFIKGRFKPDKDLIAIYVQLPLGRQEGPDILT